MKVVRNSEGETLQVLGDSVTLKLRARDSSAHMAAVVVDVPPRSGVPPHRHASVEEVYYVLEGELEVQLENERTTLRAGDMVHVAEGCLHAYRNAGHGAARFLAWTVGEVAMDEFFEEVSRTIRVLPQDMPLLERLLQRHAIQLADGSPPRE